MKNKLIAVSLMAGVMLAACSGGDGGQSREALLKSAGVAVDAPAQTPTPQVTVKQVEVIATQIVEVTRVVKEMQVQYIEVTPQPQIQGFIDAGVCDPYQPQPTVALDDADRAGGVVQRGQWCMDSYNKAVRP